MHPEATSVSAGDFEQAEGYTLLQTLAADRTFLCHDVSSNIVVLKKLDEDCLHRGQLHPSIKERLSHIRHLPHSRLATLRAVERWNGLPCLIWTWLDGETWDDSIAKSMEDFATIAGGLADAVDALHEMGIVHGNLSGRNIIVRPDRSVWLTDVSPYLYTDSTADVGEIVTLLDGASSNLEPAVSKRLGILLDQLAAGEMGLKELSHSLRGLNEEDANAGPADPETHRRYRVTSLLSAAMVALVGVGLWFGIHRFLAAQASPLPTTFPSLRPETR